MTTPSAAARGGDRLAMSALFTGAAAIAFAPIFVRLSEVGPIATGFYRLALATAVFYAGYIVAVARLRQRLSTVDVLLRSSAISAAALLLLALATGERMWPATAGGWGIPALAIVSHAGRCESA